jgi:hypothetical protein
MSMQYMLFNAQYIKQHNILSKLEDDNARGYY